MKPFSKSGDSELLLWQLADSAFPTGGFTHSGGLEAALQQGEIKSRNDLVLFVEAALKQGGHFFVPFVEDAFCGTTPLLELDQYLNACLPNHVANRASKAQGMAFLNSANKIFSNDKIRNIYEVLTSEGSPCHYAVVFGVVTRELGLEMAAAIRLYLFMQMRTAFSSAVRLGIVGPAESQAMQHRMSGVLQSVLIACSGKPLAGVTTTSPILELLQGNQDRLYSRLFQS